MDKDEWDFCGQCGHELKRRIIPSEFNKNRAYLMYVCPRKRWFRNNHDEYAVSLLDIERPVKFDRRTGRRT